MNPASQPKFGKGVKLRFDPDGGAMLLVPEGALVLNPPAAAALALVNGERTFASIVETVVEEFEVAPERASEEIGALFERLTERGFVR
ncbi:MAG TPA: PqqD family peptide modification chaperone [Candidatus Nitrosotalea sp.]|nr:PqqD family peptide modification chaperone [Candidatus Nitrosotalea sp.]